MKNQMTIIDELESLEEEGLDEDDIDFGLALELRIFGKAIIGRQAHPSNPLL